jgi:hypothetical protein
VRGRGSINWPALVGSPKCRRKQITISRGHGSPCRPVWQFLPVAVCRPPKTITGAFGAHGPQARWEVAKVGEASPDTGMLSQLWSWSFDGRPTAGDWWDWDA